MTPDSQPTTAAVYEQRRFFFVFWSMLVLIGCGGAFWLASALRLPLVVFGFLGSALVIGLAMLGLRGAKEGRTARQPEDSAVMRLVARADGEEAASPPEAPQLALRGADGVVLAVAAPTLIGRAPQPSAGREVLALPGARSVSKTHALLEPVAGHVRVTDLGSTNGTRVSATEEAPLTALPSNEATEIGPGGRIAFGNQQFQVITRTR